MDSSPAARAIGAAALVIAVSLGLYSVAAARDEWPALVLAALGAALGAGVAITAIVGRDLDATQPDVLSPARLTPAANPSSPWPRLVALAAAHQVCAGLVVVAVAIAGHTENAWWLLGATLAGFAWAGMLWRLAAAASAAPPLHGPSVYGRAFQLAAVAFALFLTYGAIAADTPWLWRPTTWYDYQALLWLVVLQFASLPLTIAAVRGEVRTKN